MCGVDRAETGFTHRIDSKVFSYCLVHSKVPRCQTDDSHTKRTLCARPHTVQTICATKHAASQAVGIAARVVIAGRLTTKRQPERICRCLDAETSPQCAPRCPWPHTLPGPAEPPERRDCSHTPAVPNQLCRLAPRGSAVRYSQRVSL